VDGALLEWQGVPAGLRIKYGRPWINGQEEYPGSSVFARFSSDLSISRRAAARHLAYWRQSVAAQYRHLPAPVFVYQLKTGNH